MAKLLSNKSNGSTQKLPEILFLTSPSKKQENVSYSQDLLSALNNQFVDSFDCSLCVLQPNALREKAKQINSNDNIKLVSIHQDFNFYKENEKGFKDFFSSISKPIVYMFHTVLPTPKAELKAKVRNIALEVDAVLVMTQNAETILINDYDLLPHKITIIPHGSHLVSLLNRRKLKKQHQLSNRKVLSTFGLLEDSKSIETTLNALPAVIKKHPDVLFLVLCKKQLSLFSKEEGQYHKTLEAKVKELKISEHVRFVSEDLPLPLLLEYLQLSDIYLSTSKDSDETDGGLFSRIMSCGCPIISTPTPSALGMLDSDSGRIFDFENSTQLSEAIIPLLENEELRTEISLNNIHQMAATAWNNSAISHALLFKKVVGNVIQLNYRFPPINFKHVEEMTSDFGMIHSAKIAAPDIHSGYTLNDNARALVAVCQHYEIFSSPEDLELINIYLQFIKHCLQPSGQFLNYVNEAEEFTTQNTPENLDDSNGRAIWALGYVISIKEILPQHIIYNTEMLLEKAIPHLSKIHSARAMAFIIKGLHYQNETENLYLLHTMAQRLLIMYKHEKEQDWFWFENYLTYGNGVLSEALLCAYLSSQDEEYKQIAEESFEFLLLKIFASDKIKVTSKKGWHIKGNTVEPIMGEEQPIDVAYTIIALEKFYAVSGKEIYKQKAESAFNWFLGKNHLHQTVYNPCTGGCYDSVEEQNINLNQGAEATLSYFMSRLSVENLFGLPQKPKRSKFESPSNGFEKLPPLELEL